RLFDCLVAGPGVPVTLLRAQVEHGRLAVLPPQPGIAKVELPWLGFAASPVLLVHPRVMLPESLAMPAPIDPWQLQPWAKACPPCTYANKSPATNSIGPATSCRLHLLRLVIPLCRGLPDCAAMGILISISPNSPPRSAPAPRRYAPLLEHIAWTQKMACAPRK